MNNTQKRALDEARQHAQAIAAHLARARVAHEAGNDEALQRCHRAAAANCTALDRAHDVLERAMSQPEQPAAHDPIANPSGAMGAQTSAGQSPRSLDPEVRRQQDQLRSCEIAFEARQRQLRGFR